MANFSRDHTNRSLGRQIVAGISSTIVGAAAGALVMAGANGVVAAIQNANTFTKVVGRIGSFGIGILTSSKVSDVVGDEFEAVFTIKDTVSDVIKSVDEAASAIPDPVPAEGEVN